MFLLKPIAKSFGMARERETSVPGGAPPRRSRLTAFAVEPRMLFDGAAPATAEAMVPTHVDAQHAEPAAPPAVMTNCTINHDPVGHDNARTTAPGQKIWDGQVLHEDGHGNTPASDPDGDALHLTGVTAGAKTDVDEVPRTGLGEAIHGQHGTLWLQADGSYCYKPDDGLTVGAGQTLHDVFSYKLCDDRGGEAISTITISITDCGAGGHSIDANPDEYWITNADTITDGKAIGGDHDSATPWHDDQADHGEGLHVVGVRAGDTGADVSGAVGTAIGGQYGALTLQPDGSYGYVVNQAGRDLARGERAQDVFTYTVADCDGHTATTTITIHLLGVNTPPVGLEHVRQTTPETSITDGTVLQPDGHGNGADYDKDGDTLTIEGVVPGDASSPTDIAREHVGDVVHGNYGDLVINRDGTYTYVPHADLDIPAGQTVTDTFSYRLCDQEGGEAVGKIRIEIPGGRNSGNPSGGGENPGNPGNPSG
ncbi:MAG: Ig-like domain-containing protein, partial [Burkholderiaceae bacterium]